MTFEQEHDLVGSLLGAYSLDAVDGDEAATVHRHLQTCPRCRAELDEHQETAGALGNAIEPPPAELWDRIAGNLRPPLTDVDDPPGAAQSRGSRRRRASRTRTAALVAMAAVAAMAAIATLAVNLTSAHDRIRTLQGALSGGSDSAAAQAALLAPGHATVSLRSPGGEQLARLVILPNGRGYLLDWRMPALPRGETYQLWAMIGGKPISAGLLGPKPGAVAFTVASGRPSAMAVTIEPSDGVSLPDRSAVAAGDVVRA
jgi:Anti-sigma-K factor rskA/Putative zinc-finger